MNLRHRFRVRSVVAEGPGMVSIYIGGERLPELRVRAGQFCRWRFLDQHHWWQAHPFSMPAAPNDDWLRRYPGGRWFPEKGRPACPIIGSNRSPPTSTGSPRSLQQTAPRSA